MYMRPTDFLELNNKMGKLCLGFRSSVSNACIEKGSKSTNSHFDYPQITKTTMVSLMI